MAQKKLKKPETQAIALIQTPKPPLTLGDALSQMTIGQGQSLENILLDLINEAKVNMITDVQQPRNLTRIEILANAYEARGFPRDAKLLRSFVNLYKVNMVSHKRGSRIEMRDMISAGLQREKSLEEKLERTT